MKAKIPLLAHATTFVLLAACFAVTPGFGQNANDGFDPNVNGPVLAIAVQPDGRILIGGNFSAVGETARTNLARLNVDGTLDTNFAPTFSFRSCGNCGAVSRLVALGDGKILIAGSFDSVNGQPRNGVARLHADGMLDTNFNNVPIGGGVNALLVLPDGKILLGGKLGLAGTPVRQGLIRVDSNGIPDSFSIFGNNSVVDSLALQADRKILVGGSFSAMGGLPRANLGRLNADGTVDTTFNPGASEQVSALVVQPDGRILVGGFFTVLGGQPRTNIGRLNPNGTLDALFNPGASHTVDSLIVQTDGRILAGGYFTNLAGQAHSRLGRLLPDGSDDAGFHPGANSNVWAIAVQSDGGILVGGDFTTLGGTNRNHLGRLYPDGSLDATLTLDATGRVADAPTGVYSFSVQADRKILVGGNFTALGGHLRQGIARLCPDGSIDATFDPSADDYVYSLCVQTDGKILVGGWFAALAGQPKNRIGRLNADGSLDVTFDVRVTARPRYFDYFVRAVVVQPDGRILVGGDFAMLGGGEIHTNLVRLNADGSLDTSFSPALNSTVTSMALQPDGKILVAGDFTALGGQPHNRIARLEASGAVDTSFNPDANGVVDTLAIQADGKILLGGSFTVLSTQPRAAIGRLHTDGSIDSSFNPGAGDGAPFYFPVVWTLAVYADGKILVGGIFNSLAGQTRNSIGRLNSDGSLDTSFDPGANDRVLAVTIQTDGKTLVGGRFTTLGGELRNCIGRLTSGSEAFESLAVSSNGASVLWRRTGAVPEIAQVTFEQSEDGTTCVLLGEASRISGGWQLTGLSLPVGKNFFVRARGRTTGGYRDNSGGLIESVGQFYLIPPVHITSVGKLGGGEFQFAFTNTTGASYTVLATTNVASPTATWEVLGAPVPVGNGLYQFTDLGGTNHARRFYQLRSP